MSAVRPSIFLLLALALLAVEIPARIVLEDEIYDPSEVSAIVEPLIRQARAPQQTTVTVTVLKTTTLSSISTTMLTLKKTCAVVAQVTPAGTVKPGDITSFTATPSVACRRRRQYWNEPLFIAMRHEDDPSMQIYRLSPSQVLNFQPTMIPQFRNTNNPTTNQIKLIKETPTVIESSFEKSPENVRIAQPIFGASLSSLISSVVSNFFTTSTTTTSYVSVYSSVITSTTYSATATYYVLGTCTPAGIVTC